MEGSQNDRSAHALMIEKPKDFWDGEVKFGIRKKKMLNPTTDGLLRNVDKDNKLTFVCLSDTHERLKQAGQEYQKKVPDGDVLIHCGDFTRNSDTDDIVELNKFLGSLPHKVKLVVAGNHEMCFQRDFEEKTKGFLDNLREELGLSPNASQEEIVKKCKSLLENAIYLEDEVITICGIDIYGSPWCPEREKSNVQREESNVQKKDEERHANIGFTLPRKSMYTKWNDIPSSTKILITHAPPCGYGDSDRGGSPAGCVELHNKVLVKVKPKFHVFGHIHSGYGMSTDDREETIFINAAVYIDSSDHAFRDPIVFECEIPKGSTKRDLERFAQKSRRQDVESRVHCLQNSSA